MGVAIQSSGTSAIENQLMLTLTSEEADKRKVTLSFPPRDPGQNQVILVPIVGNIRKPSFYCLVYN